MSVWVAERSRGPRSIVHRRDGDRRCRVFFDRAVRLDVDLGVIRKRVRKWDIWGAAQKVGELDLLRVMLFWTWNGSPCAVCSST